MPGGVEFCTLSATGIQDPSGQIFANGTWMLSFKPTPNTPGPFVDVGVNGPNFTRIFGGNLDATGSFNAGGGLVRNDSISPTGSRWVLQVTPAVAGLSYQVELNLTAASVDCTAAINAVIQNISAIPTSITRAYKDSELVNINGSGGIYYDETLKVLKAWDAATGVWISVPSMFTNYVDLTTAQNIAGVKTFTSDTILKSLNGQTWVMADQFASIQAAINALPSTGGVVDARSPNVNLTMGAIDVGSNSKPVTLLLGPFTYTFTQIIVRQGFNILGAGYLNTVLSNVGTNANPAFVIPQVNNNAITIHWSDFQVLGLAGNTSQDGIFFDGSTLTNAGVELSTFTNIQLTGFKGVGIHLKATQDGISGSIGAIQFNSFFNVTSIRPTGATGATQNALRIEGGCGQIYFCNCIFQGASNDTGTNVFTGTNGVQAPYSIHHHITTNQNGFAYLFDGALGCTTEKDHFENIKGCYNFATTASPVLGFKAKEPYINSNVAVNAGNGYIINVPNGVPQIDVLVDTPFIGGQPDNGIKNLSNATNVRIINAQINPLNTPVNVIPNTGTTFQGTPAATLDIHCCRTVQLSASATSITTLKSGLQPGESVTFYTTGGTAQFATGGNLSLGTNMSPFILQANDSVTFTRVDAGTPAFVLTGYSRQGIAQVDLTGQTANIGSTLLYTVPATGAGTYKVTVYVVVTSVGTTSTMPNMVIGFTDKDNNTVQSVPFTVTSTGNTLTTLAVNSLPISAKASTNINYSTTGYASTGTAMQYALHIKLEYMGS